MHGEMLVSSYWSSLLLADSYHASVSSYGRPFYLPTAIMHGEMLVSSYWSSLLHADSNQAW